MWRADVAHPGMMSPPVSVPPEKMATTRLNIPQLRVCPPDVLRQLREIDDTAELVYMGDGVWMLGSVNRTSVRERAGRFKMKRAAQAKIVGDTPTRLRKLARWRFIAWEGMLLTQGFAPIQVFHGDPDGRIAEYLRERTYCWARQLDEAYARAMRDDDSPDAEHDAAISSYLDEYKLREGYRRMVKVLRPAKGIVVNGTRTASPHTPQSEIKKAS